VAYTGVALAIGLSFFYLSHLSISLIAYVERILFYLLMCLYIPPCWCPTHLPGRCPLQVPNPSRRRRMWFVIVESSSLLGNLVRHWVLLCRRILFVVLEYAALVSNPSTFSSLPSSSLLASSRVGTSPSPCTAGIPGFKYPLPMQGQGGLEVLVGD
jgi:hypothetical protein